MKSLIGLACSSLVLAPFALLSSCSSGSGDGPAGNGSAGQLPLGWVPTFTAEQVLGEAVLSLTVFDDGAGGGPALFAGGLFTAAGERVVNRIAKREGLSWAMLDGGMDAGVFALQVHDDGMGHGPALYAGGAFTEAGGMPAARVARWNGGAWSTLGMGMNGSVLALTVFDDGSGAGPELYAGGTFTTADGSAAERIAKWNGSAWSALGTGLNGTVSALGVFDDGSGPGPALYVGGSFTAAGGAPAAGMARWNGSSWSALGEGVNGFVSSLAVFDDGSSQGPALYAGGTFSTAGGSPAVAIARWDGASWSNLGTGMNFGVEALRVFDDGAGSGPALYAGGFFTTADGQSASHIARWNGNDWRALGTGLNGDVYSLVDFDDGTGQGPSLFAGGFFTEAGEVEARHLARWNDFSWSALGAGLSGSVHSLAAFDDGSGGGSALHVGGNFTKAGGVLVNYVAKWSAGTWSALGEGLTEDAFALEVFDDGAGAGPALYAGGDFDVASATLVNGIAKWDGFDWSPLGSGMNSFVFALRVFDDGSGSGPALVAGGTFGSAGGTVVNGIAEWDGSDWSPLGSGMDHEVSSLEVFDDGSGSGAALFAGGAFTTAGGVEANHIARWNGLSWSPLGSGLNGNVQALAVFDDGSGGGPALYVGGTFTVAGGAEANRIARWDGQSWTPLDSGLNGSVRALAVFDDRSGDGPALYVGGAFTMAGELAASGIARWDGSTWSGLGAGVGSTVRALLVFDDGTSSGGIAHGPSLFVAGGFNESPGGDAFLAKWGRSAQAVPSNTKGILASLPGDPALEETGCALTARIGAELRLDDPGAHLVLERSLVAPARNLEWLAGTIELRGGVWRQTEPLVLGIAGPARLRVAQGARLEIPRVIVGPQGELVGSGMLLGELENQGLVSPTGDGLELRGPYLQSPPGRVEEGPLARLRAEGRPAPPGCHR